MIKVILKIVNINACKPPANKSKYMWANAGTPNLNINGNSPYIKLKTIKPPKIFPNKRKLNEIGIAKSPITFNGNINGIGSKNSLKYPLPFLKIPIKCISPKVDKPNASVVPRLAVGGLSANSPE